MKSGNNHNNQNLNERFSITKTLHLSLEGSFDIDLGSITILL